MLPKITGLAGVACGAVVQTWPLWQFSQRKALEMGPGARVSPWFTCARCAPMRLLVVTPPLASLGGEARTRNLVPRPSIWLADATGVRLASPWQPVQVRLASSL